MKKETKRNEEFAKAYEAFINSGRTYVGLVPLLEDDKLKPPARILFQIISSLSYVEGFCFATNETLGIKLGLKTTMVKGYLRELERSQLITMRKASAQYGFRREIYLNFEGLHKRYNKTTKQQDGR